jgi:hypothetical protein
VVHQICNWAKYKNRHSSKSTLSSLINKHARLFFSRKKIHPTRFYLRAFYRQAAPNFAYLFDEFEVKIPAYLFIRELRVIQIQISTNEFVHM